MHIRIYQSLERIINVTSIANKWLRWCEQNLPSQAVYVPSIFQMRDAYSHIVSMFAQGIAEQGLSEASDEETLFDEVAFFKSENVEGHLAEVTDHSLRAFFDAADYIVETLAELSSNTDNVAADKYSFLRAALTKFDPIISELRAQKSNVPEIAYQVVEKWDKALQIITSSYAFSNYEQVLHQRFNEAISLALNIEQCFDEETIKKYDEQFYKKKAELYDLIELPDKYQLLASQDTSLMEIIVDPTAWQQEIASEFESKTNKLTEYREWFQRLLKVMPNTEILRKTKQGHAVTWKILSFLGSTVISALVTTFVTNKLFITVDPEAGSIILDNNFFVYFCLIFIAVVFVLLGVIKLIQWLYLKRQLKKLKTAALVK